MINISICDDNEYDIKQINEELEKYSLKKRVQLK